jgi:Acetyltransferase (isoleucine patch superfamily)
MVRAGCRVGDNSVVGARAVVQGDVPDHHVVVGTPARSIRVKPGWEDAAAEVEDGRLPDNQDDREIEYALPDDLDRFDEFERDLRPPGRPE